MGLLSQADMACRAYYSKAHIHTLERRLGDYFHGSKRQSRDAAHAFEIFEKLKKSDQETNLKIFDMYLSVLESVPGSKQVMFEHSYDVTPWAAQAKADIFQERYWEWSRLYEYFFMTPITMDFNRQRDLDYLSHVARTAKESKQETSNLRDILQRANHTWVQTQLSRFPDIQAEYNDYQKNRSISSLYEDLVSEFKKWYSTPTDSTIRQKRWVQTLKISESLRTTNAAFDLFLATKYLEAIKQYLKDSDSASFLTPSVDMQMTDWDMHVVGLPLGNFDVLNDFVHQNSYDYINKAYTVSILNTMKAISPRLQGKTRHNFSAAYLISKKIIDKRIPQEPPPTAYQSDLHLYAPSSNPELHIYNSFNEAWVRWNPVLGRPLVNTVNKYFPKNNHLALTEVTQLLKYMDEYFTHARGAKTFQGEEINIEQQKEMSANVNDSTYFVSTHPNTYVLIAMTRLLNATHIKTHIENEFKHIELPERKLGIEIREIGRLLATSAASGRSLRRIMAPVAQYLKFTNAKGVIYFSCGEGAKNLYSSFNAQIFKTPEQLDQAPGDTPQWIMKYTTEDFIKEYLTPEHVTVQTRKKL